MPLLSNTPLDRVMIFIDYRNVIYGFRTTFGYTPDWRNLDLYRLCMNLSGDRRLVGAYVFDGQYDLSKDTEGKVDRVAYDTDREIHDRMAEIGFRVFLSPIDPKSNEQKEVDVDMACEMVAHAFRDSYDVAIVVSGDRDFVPAIRRVREAGKRAEVAAFNCTFSDEMRKMCDRYARLDSIPFLSMPTDPDSKSFQEEVIDNEKPSSDGEAQRCRSRRWTSTPGSEATSARTSTCPKKSGTRSGRR